MNMAARIWVADGTLAGATTPMDGRRAGDDLPWTGWPWSEPKTQGPGSGRRRVLVPFSGSPGSVASIGTIADWCSVLGAEAWVLYVRPWDVGRGYRFAWETAAEARAVAQHGALLLRDLGVNASAVTREARREAIVKAIVGEADAVEATSILMSARVRRFPALPALGSLSAAVSRRSRRPVLVVPTTTAPARP
jgi:nucleotide-binding universal stress UspA family protein